MHFRRGVALLWILLELVSCTSDNETDSLDYEEPEIRQNSSGSFYIGGVMPDNEAEFFFQTTIQNLNFDGKSVCSSCTLYDVNVIASDNPIRDANSVCNDLISKGVSAIVLGGGNVSSSVTAAVSYTGGFYQIPIIGTLARESAFSDKNIHVSFLRTVPPYSHQVDVWVKLLKTFNYSQIVFIHSSDSDGRTILGKLQGYAENIQDEVAFKITTVVGFESGSRDFHAKLHPLQESLVRVFVLYANKEDADGILKAANEIGITGKGSVWLLTEEALISKHVPVGAIGLKLKYLEDQHAHISDSLTLVSWALRNLYDKNPNLITSPPSSCDDKEPWDITGKLLFKTILEQILYDGKTGKVAFDINGDRKYAEYEIVNAHRLEIENGLPNEIEFQTIGEYHYNQTIDLMKLNVNLSKIVWSGGAIKKPSGILVPRNVKVLTIEETPFLFAENKSSDTNCTDEDESLCTWRNPDTLEEYLKCCYGYCVELLKALAKNNDFSFTLHLSHDGQFGENVYSNEGIVWTGMIGELANQTGGADMIVAPLTINQERAKVIDFTKPFKYQGITILMKKVPYSNALVSILQPFQFNLWLMLLATVHAIALLIWLLDRLSPMFKHDGTETDSLKISEAFWFSWGVILNSGLGEGTPRCLSSRVMSMIWAGFAMILVASYTANLAAFLVLEDHGEIISGINDPKLRNPVDNFLFATVKGSSVDMFFRRKTEWSNMYRMLEENNYDSVDEAIKAVKNGSLQAFIWDSSRLEYEAAKDCELITVGELFGRSGYGIGLRKGLFWSEKITVDILEFHENGFMADLDERWIWDEGETECPPDRSNSPQRLGLANLEGIFMMVVGGVGSGTILIIIELTYERYIKKKTEPENEETKEEVKVKRGIKGKYSSQQSPTAAKRRSSMSHSDQSIVCDFCNESMSDPENYGCQFCSQMASDTSTSNGSDMNDAIQLRLLKSENIPKSLKDLSLKGSLKYKLKTRQLCNENKRGVCIHHEYSSKSLVAMLNFLEESGVEEGPCCSPIDFESSPFNLENEPPTSCPEDEESSSSDSIVSGQFSCSRKWDNSRRCKNIQDDLPDVVFNKNHHENSEMESETEWKQRGNIVEI